jgi:hypothetical protein
MTRFEKLCTDGISELILGGNYFVLTRAIIFPEDKVLGIAPLGRNEDFDHFISLPVRLQSN